MLVGTPDIIEWLNGLWVYCDFQTHANSAQVNGYYEIRFSQPSVIIMVIANEPWKQKETKWIEIYQSQVTEVTF